MNVHISCTAWVTACVHSINKNISTKNHLKHAQPVIYNACRLHKNRNNVLQPVYVFTFARHWYMPHSRACVSWRLYTLSTSCSNGATSLCWVPHVLRKSMLSVGPCVVSSSSRSWCFSIIIVPDFLGIIYSELMEWYFILGSAMANKWVSSSVYIRAAPTSYLRSKSLQKWGAIYRLHQACITRGPRKIFFGPGAIGSAVPGFQNNYFSKTI